MSEPTHGRGGIGEQAFRQGWSASAWPGRLDIVAAALTVLGGILTATGLLSFQLLAGGQLEVGATTPDDLARRIQWARTFFQLTGPGGLFVIVLGVVLHCVAGFVNWQRSGGKA